MILRAIIILSLFFTFNLVFLIVDNGRKATVHPSQAFSYYIFVYFCLYIYFFVNINVFKTLFYPMTQFFNNLLTYVTKHDKTKFFFVYFVYDDINKTMILAFNYSYNVVFSLFHYLFSYKDSTLFLLYDRKWVNYKYYII